MTPESRFAEASRNPERHASSSEDVVFTCCSKKKKGKRKKEKGDVFIGLGPLARLG
jgi:hypothetical protein